MITCHITYQIDPAKLPEFEAYAKAWIPLVERFGGTHHGYFLPHEGPNDLAFAAFSFSSLAAYEAYRQDSMNDAECQAAYYFAVKTNCIKRYDRYFLRPVLEGDLSPFVAKHD
ncbi:MAG: NIPSNAP family protein [Pseudoruegeria sp.]